MQKEINVAYDSIGKQVYEEQAGRYAKIIEQGIDGFCEELYCEVDHGVDTTYYIELNNGCWVELNWFDMVRVANICDAVRYAHEIADRLDDPERYAGERYRQLRAELDARGVEAAVEIVRAIDECRSEVVESDDADLAGRFAAEVVGEGFKDEAEGAMES